MPLASPDRKFSYDDYLTWAEGERWEIIDGVAYDMTPAPTLLHQRLVLRFGSLIDQALRGRRCTVLVSPVDTVFSKYDVVQPDVVVVTSGIVVVSLSSSPQAAAPRTNIATTTSPSTLRHRESSFRPMPGGCYPRTAMRKPGISRIAHALRLSQRKEPCAALHDP